MAAPYEVHLASRYLRFHRGRGFLSVITIISLAGVAVGTAALVIALSLMTGFREDVRARILRGSAHLQVLSAGGPSFDDAEELIRRIETFPGVRAAAPVYFAPAMITNESAGLPAFAEVLGVDPKRQAGVADFGGADPLSVLLETPTEARAGIVLGVDLAKKLGVGAGDSVRITVPRIRLSPFGALPKSLVAAVAGTFRTDSYPQDAQRAYVDLEAARRLLDAPGETSWVEVGLVDARKLEVRREEIQRQLGSDFVVVDLLEQNRDILRALNTEKVMMFLAIGLIVVVAALNIVSTLILMVHDKIREIGTLTAMGAVPRGVAAVFVFQGLVIGVLGSSAGLALGTAVSWWLDTYRIIALDPNVYFITHVPFETRAVDVVAVGALAVGVSLLATVYPAWKAATLSPVEAIRHE